MRMPKATIHKDHTPVFRHHYIRCAWQRLDVHAEPEPEPVQHAADRNLGLRVGGADPAHHLAPAFRADQVHALILPQPRVFIQGKSIRAMCYL